MRDSGGDELMERSTIRTDTWPRQAAQALHRRPAGLRAGKCQECPHETTEYSTVSRTFIAPTVRHAVSNSSVYCMFMLLMLQYRTIRYSTKRPYLMSGYARAYLEWENVLYSKRALMYSAVLNCMLLRKVQDCGTVHEILKVQYSHLQAGQEEPLPTKCASKMSKPARS